MACGIKTLLRCVAGDFCILLVIVAATLVLLNFRIHDRQIDRARGLVVYSPVVDKSLAIRLCDEMVAVGLFDGVPHLLYLDFVAGVYDLYVVVAPEVLNSDVIQQRLADALHGVCVSVFDDESVIVRLEDEDSQQHGVLLEYTPTAR
ncbi:MAG: hypothetical protein MK102_12695 [Fuerstiella sp.]|nr:hypothetical protein [Fuerstiella sp.]